MIFYWIDFITPWIPWQLSLLANSYHHLWLKTIVNIGKSYKETAHQWKWWYFWPLQYWAPCWEPSRALPPLLTSRTPRPRSQSAPWAAAHLAEVSYHNLILIIDLVLDSIDRRARWSWWGSAMVRTASSIKDSKRILTLQKIVANITFFHRKRCHHSLDQFNWTNP